MSTASHVISRRSVLASLGLGLAATAATAQPFCQKLDHCEMPRTAHVDTHVHLVGGPQRKFTEAVEFCLADMDQFGIRKAVIMSPPQAPPGYFDYGDFIPELRRHGSRFIFLGGGGTLNPTMHRYRDESNVTPHVRQAFVDSANRILDNGATGFGEIAVLHLSLFDMHPFEEVSSAHPLLWALASIADRRKVLIDLHLDPVPEASREMPVSLKAPPNSRILRPNISDFERLLAAHRGARIVWAHGGSDLTGNMTPALIGRLMDAHPNLFMSLRPIPPRAAAANPFGLRFHNLILTPSGIARPWLGLLRRHPERFVIGSDAFFVPSSLCSRGPAAALSYGTKARLIAGNVLLARMPPDLADGIGRTNPARIYGA